MNEQASFFFFGGGGGGTSGGQVGVSDIGVPKIKILAFPGAYCVLTGLVCFGWTWHIGKNLPWLARVGHVSEHEPPPPPPPVPI